MMTYFEFPFPTNGLLLPIHRRFEQVAQAPDKQTHQRLREVLAFNHIYISTERLPVLPNWIERAICIFVDMEIILYLCKVYTLHVKSKLGILVEYWFNMAYCRFLDGQQPSWYLAHLPTMIIPL